MYCLKIVPKKFFDEKLAGSQKLNVKHNISYKRGFEK